MQTEQQHLDVLAQVLERCRAEGASAADAVLVESERQGVRVRLGDVDQATRSRSVRLGVRAFVGSRSAVSSTNDLAPDALRALVRETVAYARVNAEDPAAGLPDAALYGTPPAPAPAFDPAALSLSVDAAVSLARRAEDAARGADARIRNSEGAELAWSLSRVSLANSLGFAGSYRRSGYTLFAEPVAEQDGQKEVDYWLESRVQLADLPSPETIGARAAARALRRLGARKIASGPLPLVFEAPVASRLLGYLAAACDGGAVYRRATFLAERLGTPVAAPGVTVVDDPLQPLGLATRPFDGEGLASQRNVLVADGVLATFLLDSYTARKLGAATTRSAGRAAGSRPSPGSTNLRLAAGPTPPEEIVRGVRRGLLVTGLLGSGVNLVTGDLSQGATGVLIEDGALGHAVSEVTVAGSLGRIFLDVAAVGDDLDPHRTTSAPTLRVDGMTVAGL
jgi:PmbA protein